MRKEQYYSKELKTLIIRNKIVTMVEMKEALGTTVDATIFRKLKELSYLRSYSHRGKYYTVPRLARFDKQGLWSCRGVHFSKQGSLLDTIKGSTKNNFGQPLTKVFIQYIVVFS